MKLLQIEYKKIVGNKSFKVFSIMFLVFLPLLAILIPALYSINFNGEDFYLFIPSSYEASWYSICFISSWFCFFLLSFVLIYHITNEYNYRTVRQNVIDGFTRTEYLKGKIYLMLAIVVLATVYVFLIGLIGGLIFSAFDAKDPTAIQEFFNSINGGNAEVEETGFGSIFDGMENVFRFFVQSLGSFSLAFLIAFLAKRGILAVLIFYGAFLTEKIAGYIIEGNGFGALNEYLPLHAFMNVLPYPNLIELLSGITSPATIDWLAVGLSLLYSIIFVYLAKVLFFKRDIT